MKIDEEYFIQCIEDCLYDYGSCKLKLEKWSLVDTYFEELSDHYRSVFNGDD